MEKSKKERIEKLSEKTKNLNLDNELYILLIISSGVKKQIYLSIVLILGQI